MGTTEDEMAEFKKSKINLLTLYFNGLEKGEQNKP